MRSPNVVAVGVWLVSCLASAQELGLDLTDSTDYRPTAAIVGPASVDGAAPASLKLEKISSQWVSAAQGTGSFTRVSTGVAGETSCAEVTCLSALAAKLDVNQLFVGQLLRVNGALMLRLISFTRYTNKLESTQLPASTGQRTFLKDSTAALTSMARKARTTLALLKIASDTKGATASLDGTPMGPVPLAKLIPGGTHALKVSAEGYLPDDIDVSITAGETKQVESNLTVKPPEMPSLSMDTTQVSDSDLNGVQLHKTMRPPLFKRPGLYVAVAGLLAAGAGVALGMQAKSIEARAIDANHDGALDITGREAATARTDALLANVLVGAGAAAVVGGGLWMVLATTPPSATAQADHRPGVMLAIGGSLP